MWTRAWRVWAGALTLTAALAVGACGDDESDGGSAGGTPKAGSVTEKTRGGPDKLALTAEEAGRLKSAGSDTLVGIVSPISIEYLASVVDGAKAEASRLGVKTEVFDYQFDAARGVTGIETLTGKGAKYIIVVMTDPPAMMGAVKAAQAQGVTVIQFAGRQVEEAGGPRGVSVSIDDAQLGTVAGQVAAKVAKPFGRIKVATLDFPDQPNVIIRADNMEKELKAGAPGVDLVGRYPGATQEKGLTSMESALQKDPDIRGVISINDAGAYGAVQALERAGVKPNEGFVIGVDAEKKARKLIGDDTLFKASVDTQPALTGKLAVDVAGALLAGKDVPQYVPVPVEPVTAAGS